MVMLTYKKLPKGTPRWVTTAIFWLGGALGIAISIQSLLALYGLSGFLITLYYPNSTFTISPHEASYLGYVGASAGLSALTLSFLAVRMNQLSKRAIGLSQIMWIPLSLTSLLVFWGHRMIGFRYGVPAVWVFGMFISVVFGAILPWLLLRDPAVAKAHKNH